MGRKKFKLVLYMKENLTRVIESATSFSREECEKFAERYLEIIKEHDVIDCGGGVRFRKEEER